jgi:hypothetical protein
VAEYGFCYGDYECQLVKDLEGSEFFLFEGNIAAFHWGELKKKCENMSQDNWLPAGIQIPYTYNANSQLR